MRNTRLLSLAAMASLALTACKPDDASSQGPLTVGGFYDAATQANKEWLRRCIPSISPAYLEAQMNEDFDQAKSDAEKAVAAARLAFDADKAAACLQETMARSCDFEELEALNDGEICDQVFKPLVATGGECYLDMECVGGGCDTEASCPGKCVVAQANLGEGCAQLPCASGLYCDASNRICVARKAAGAACLSESECVRGLGCTNGKCVEEEAPSAGHSGTAGEECAEDSCGDGLYCSAGSFTQSTGICAVTKAEGSQCGDGFPQPYAECGSSRVCAGLTVDLSTQAVNAGRCADWADVGAACAVAAEGALTISGCMLGLVCADGRRAMPPTMGPCAPALGGARCDPRSAYCDDNEQCALKKANGASCGSNAECQSRDCTQGKCYGGCHP